MFKTIIAIIITTVVVLIIMAVVDKTTSAIVDLHDTEEHRASAQRHASGHHHRRGQSHRDLPLGASNRPAWAISSMPPAGATSNADPKAYDTSFILRTSKPSYIAPIYDNGNTCAVTPISKVCDQYRR
jgi:hypothetical protein